jgi:hypothetical protein
VDDAAQHWLTKVYVPFEDFDHSGWCSTATILRWKPQRVTIGDHDLEELMSGSVKDIKVFIASREGELFETDYRAMLEHEEAKKRPRASLVRGLKALIGET